MVVRDREKEGGRDGGVKMEEKRRVSVLVENGEGKIRKENRKKTN